MGTAVIHSVHPRRKSRPKPAQAARNSTPMQADLVLRPQSSSSTATDENAMGALSCRSAGRCRLSSFDPWRVAT
jgi:hypothetical protein